MSLPERFNFQHADLRRAGAVFVRGQDRLPMLKMDFGDLKGSLPLNRLSASLQLQADGIDAALLALVPEALRYVRQVRAGDPVPSELRDGRLLAAATACGAARRGHRMARHAGAAWSSAIRYAAATARSGRYRCRPAGAQPARPVSRHHRD